MKDTVTKEQADQLIRLWALLITDQEQFAREYSAVTAMENGVSLKQNYDVALTETGRYRAKKSADGCGYKLTADGVATRNTMSAKLPNLWLKKSSTTLERLHRFNNAMEVLGKCYKESVLVYYSDIGRTQEQAAELLGFNPRKIRRAIDSARSLAVGCY